MFVLKEVGAVGTANVEMLDAVSVPININKEVFTIRHNFNDIH